MNESGIAIRGRKPTKRKLWLFLGDNPQRPHSQAYAYGARVDGYATLIHLLNFPDFN